MSCSRFFKLLLFIKRKDLKIGILATAVTSTRDIGCFDLYLKTHRAALMNITFKLLESGVEEVADLLLHLPFDLRKKQEVKGKAGK